MGQDDYSDFAGSGATSSGKGLVVRGVKLSYRDVIMALAVIFLAVLSVALVISLAVVTSRRGGATSPASSDAPCTRKVCLQYAGALIQNINKSGDPCDDFYQYTCVDYSRQHPINPEHDYRSTTVDVLRANELNLHVQLWEDVKRVGTTSWERKLKYYFRSCMDEGPVQEAGGRPLVDAINTSGGWCVLQPGEPAPGSTWGDYGKQLSQIQVNYRSWPFFRVEVIETPDNSLTHMLKLSMDGLGMEAKQYMEQVELLQMSYMTYMRSVGMLVARDAGLNLTDTTQDTASHVDRFAEEVYALEKDLANATINTRDSMKNNQIMTLDSLKIISSQIDYKGILTAMFPDAGITDSTKVMLDYAEYYGDVDKIIQKALRKRSAGVRVINNYLVWRLMQSFVPMLSADYRSTSADLQVALSGTPETKSRWETCFSEMSSRVPLALSALYVRTISSESQRQYVEKYMLPHLMNAFEMQVNGLRWMDEKTKKAAIEKVMKMKRIIGYSQEWLSDIALDTTYQQLTIRPDRLSENTISYWNYVRRDEGARLMASAGKPRLDEVKLWDPHFDFSHRWNTLLVPAGVLQPALMAFKLPVAVNMASLGAAMGSSMLGAVDIIGSHYAADGTVVPWWTPDTTHAYLGHWSCSIEFWNNTETGPWIVDGNSRSVKVNAQKFARYHMSDVGGLRQGFLAYKDFLKNHPMKGQTLPGLFQKYTGDQLFFHSFAHTHCTHQRQQAGYEAAKDGYVPPAVRINGALKQFPEFQRAFNCPATSRMVAPKICEGF